MKYLVVLSFFATFFTAKAGEVPELIGKSHYGVLVNKNGKIFQVSKAGSRKFKIYDTKTKKTLKGEKLPKELAMHSKVISLNNKWVYVHDEEKSSFKKAKYKLVELNEDGSYSHDVPALECEEKVGSYQFYGFTARTSMVPHAIGITKSENEKYVCCLASKIYGSTSKQAGMVNLDDYKKTEETTNFALFNSKLELVKKGSFKPGVKRGYIRSFRTFVSGTGDLYFLYVMKQEYVKKSSRILLVKIAKEGESVQKVTLNLPKFNTDILGIIFKDDSFVFSGFVMPFEKEEREISGLFYATINNAEFQVDELNVVLFSEKIKTELNQIYKNNGQVLAKWESKNNSVFPQMSGHVVKDANNNMLGLMCKYKVPVVSATAISSMVVGHSYSSPFLIRFGKDNKSIKDVTTFSAPNGQNAPVGRILNLKGKTYFSYSSSMDFRAIEIPNDFGPIGKSITIGAAEKGEYNYSYGGGDYYFIEASNELIIGMNKISDRMQKRNRIGVLKVKLP